MNGQLFILIVFGMSIGVGLVVQSAINTDLRHYLSTPLQAAFISFLVGTVVLGVACWVQGGKWFTVSTSQLPMWLWLGGCLGAYNIAMTIGLAPRLGAFVLMMSIVFGQMLSSLLLDHYGILGFHQERISFNKILGACLILLGLMIANM